MAFDRNHHRSKTEASWPVTSVQASFAAVLGNISWKPVIIDADAVHWKQSMTYFDHSYVIKFSFFMWEEKNLLSNTNNIISKTVIHHHTCKTKAFGRLDWQIRWTTSIFHQSNYSLLFSWTTSGNTNLKNCHFGNITFFFLSHYNPSYSHKKECHTITDW